MPYIPHTQADVDAMLTEIGVENVDALFDEAAPEHDVAPFVFEEMPEALNEAGITRVMRARSQRDAGVVPFIGAGAYDHHIPAAVWEIVGRGEFMTAYTPYQAEASQGTLQTLYEFQSMIAGLLDMDAANASLYDGASALGEAILMAVRCHRKKSRKVLIPATVHPAYRRTAQTLTEGQGIELIDVPYDPETGLTDWSALEALAGSAPAAVVIPQPNFFGGVEAVDALTDWAQEQGALAIAVVNPLALALLKPPGAWGKKGADIAVGEGQPLGAPLSSGGPYFGLMGCRKAYLRQMPGRIAGQTTDGEGRVGYVLTLQTREQHIRRSRATSNICTNQGLLTAAAAVHMSILGPEGLRRVALSCHENMRYLSEQLEALPGVSVVFSSPFFHERVIKLSKPVPEVLGALVKAGFVGGYDLGRTYPELENHLLVCVTENRLKEEMDGFVQALGACLSA